MLFRTLLDNWVPQSFYLDSDKIAYYLSRIIQSRILRVLRINHLFHHVLELVWTNRILHFFSKPH